MSQLFIGIFGLTAIILVNARSAEFQKWGPIFGLLSQPFWFYSTFQAEQWGIFGLSFIYTFLWMRGFYNRWIFKQI